MAEVILHIGTQKTGTTALQHFWAENREVLRTLGIDYPASEEFLIKPGLNRNRNGIWINRCEGDPEYEIYMERLLAHCTGDMRVLLSDEDLYWRIHREPELLKRFRDRLAAHGVGLSVVLYLRRQDEYLCSLWAFQIKINGTSTLQEWLAKDAGRRGDYAALVDRLTELLGEAHVYLRTYERKRFQGGSIYADFLSIFGLSLSDAMRLPAQEMNASLADACLEAKRRLNERPGGGIDRENAETDPVGYRRAQLLQHALMDAQDQMRAEGVLKHCSFFLPGEREALLARYAEGNAAIARRFFARETLFEETAVAASDGEPVSAEELIEIYQRMILVLGTWAAEQTPSDRFEIGMTSDELIRQQKETIRALEEQMRLRNLPSLVVRKLRKRRNGKRRKK
ncbi:MAG: hypothetical protein IJT34_05480 [Butyrivibrio sp.]|nr:hypothetical protein [Butyrivibrio sp.]